MWNMEIKKDSGNKETVGNKETKDAVLRYLLRFGKENKFRLARVFKIGTEEVIAALQALENERKIVMEGSKAKPVTRSMKKELERGAEKVGEVGEIESSTESSTAVEESEKAIEQWLADMK